MLIHKFSKGLKTQCVLFLKARVVRWDWVLSGFGLQCFALFLLFCISRDCGGQYLSILSVSKAIHHQ